MLETRKIKSLEKKMLIKDFYAIRKLRSGNFGCVYACYNQTTDKKYAIKVILKREI